jgi:hypothetical protein
MTKKTNDFTTTLIWNGRWSLKVISYTVFSLQTCSVSVMKALMEK